MVAFSHRMEFVKGKRAKTINIILKGLESTLTDPKKRYPDKVNALLSAWESVTVFISTSTKDASDALINWAYRHTLNLVLQGDWPRLSPATKTHLSVTLQRCAGVLSNHSAGPKCRSLIALVKDPWGHPVLNGIINGATNVEDADVIAFCNSENGDVLSMRLEMLCESQCEDLALRLAEAIRRCLRLTERKLLDRNTDEHLLYIFEIYISLLYKYKKINKITKELMHFDLKEGLQLIKRSLSKSGKSSRVWRQNPEVTELVAQYFLTSAMVKPVSEIGSLLEELITEWTLLFKNSPTAAQTLPNMIRKIIQPAESAMHIYAFCQILVQQFGDALKSFCIELYIRGLTTDMNELEQQKVKNDKAKVREAEVRLSDGFLKLADLMKDNVGVCRECVLTAFSLNPTQSCYERIKEMAVASGKLKLPGRNNSENKDKEMVPNSNEENCSREENMISDNNNSEKDQDNNNFKHESGMAKEQNNKSSVMVDTGQLLKCSSTANSEISSPLIPESTAMQINRCNKHPPFDSTKGKSPGELCPECGEFTGIETPIPPKTESGVTKKARALDALILIKGTTVTESLNYDVLSAPNQVLDAETLGLAPQLCNDLAVVLSSPRYQMLSWVMDWPELKLMCESYLENVDDYRNVTKELKFLHIDYNQFKDLPSDEDEKDEYYGIEKGYEQWADLSSEEEYTLSKSRKRRARRIETTDSDSSLFPRSRKGRKANRLDSSESEYDSYQRKGKSKRKNRRTASSSVSDSDTGTQDSRTDSLGSDGYNIERPSKKEKNGRNERTSSRKRSHRKQKEVKHFAMVVNEHIKVEKKNDISKNEVMKLFAHIEDSGNEKANPQLAPILQISSDKRSSDPSVLKTLRMFRPQNAKKTSNDHLTQIMQSNHVIPQKDALIIKQDDNSPYTKFAPMLSTIDLNPRIILTRTDTANQELKSYKGLAQNSRPINPMSQIKPDIMCRKSPTKNMSFNIEHNQFPVNNGMGDVSVRHEYFKNDLLAKTVPGLNSLDMIVPPPSEATVQVVQLPRNTPSTSNNGQGNSHLPPKTSQASGNASNVNSGQDPDSSSNTREISNSQASQSVSFSSLECPQGSLPTSDTGSTATHGQPKVSKLTTPVEVKYLTTTSEVNEILRSTLGDGAHSVQTVPLASPTVQHTLSLTKQRLTSRPEVKYLTSTSEVNEILRSTLGENAQVSTVSSASSQHRIANVDFACQNKAKLNTRTDVRYVTSSSEVNEILRNTQVVQKTGQSSASLDSNACAGSVAQLPTSSHQTISSRPVNPMSPFPVVKGVDLNVIASLISSKNCSNSVPPSPDSSSSGTTDSQMLQIVCQGRKINLKPLLFPHPGNRTAVTDQAVESAHSQIPAPSTSAQTAACSENEQQQQQQQQQQQHVLAHSIYEEEFPEFSQSAQTLDSSCKEKLSGKAQKPVSSPLASLPKFQQAFGKSIYNQTGSSSNMDNKGTQNASVRANEDISSETQNETPQENTDTSSQSQATVTSSSSVLSKAVQTTCIGSGISSQPPTPALAQQSPTNNSDVGSTLHVASAGQVFSILQGSPQIAVSAATALRVGAGMTVQAIQTSSGVIYMRPEATTLVTSGTGAAHTSTVSTRRNQGVKTASLSQAAETVQQSHLPETPSNSVAVAIAPQTSSVLSRETVKRNRILTASLQSTSHKPVSLGNTASLATNAINSPQIQDPEVCVVESSSDEEVSNTGQQTLVSSSVPRATTQKSGTRTLVPSARQVRPILHIPGGNVISRISATNVTPSRQQSVQSVLVSPVSSASSATAAVSTRLTQNVCGSDALITHSAIEPTVSSTTLEQLREFESVLEQVTNTSQMKERSTVQPQSQTQAQTQQHSLLTQQLLLTQAVTSSTSSAMEFTTCTSSQTTPTSYTQEIFPVVSSATATSRVSVTYVTQAAAVRTSNIPPSSAAVTATIGTVGKMSSSPVVVVTSYCQSVASPTLSVTSQSSSSPCVTPAPAASTTSGKTPPKSSKSSKSKSVKSGTAATTSKASPVPKPQQKPQEDEQTAQRIYAILDEYAEQLRNSPDLNNKPAPRRRSNPPTNPNQSSKRKKSAQTKVKLLGHQSSSTAPEMSPGADDPRTLGSEDSSSGITQLSHIQDSPAPSSQNPDDTLSLRATPSLELTTDAGTLRGVVSDSGELGDNAKQQEQEHQEQSGLVHESEQPEREQSPLQLQSSQSQASSQGILFTEGSSIQGQTVIVQDAVPSNSAEVVASGSNTPLVAGKPVMVGNSFLTGVRQVIVPMTASVQGRPVLMPSKCPKVIRLHPISSVPGGPIQVTPAVSGMPGTTLVVRQIKPSAIPMPTVAATSVSVLGQPTVKQVKLPVGSISSQTLTGVTAQPPVVLPPGSHHLTGQVGNVVTSTIAHTLSFRESGIEGVLQDSAVKTEPSNVINTSETILLNAGTSSQAIGLIRRGISGSLQERICTSNTSTMPNPSVSASLPMERLTYPRVSQVSSVTLDSDMMSVGPSTSALAAEAEQENCNVDASSGHVGLTLSNHSISSGVPTQPTRNIQSLGVEFATQTVRGNTSFHAKQIKDSSSDTSTPKCDNLCAVVSGSLDVDSSNCNLDSIGSHLREENEKSNVSKLDRECSAASVEQMSCSSSCQTSQPQLLQSTNSSTQHDNISVFHTTGSSTVCANPLREDIFIQDRASGSDLQEKSESHNQGMAAPLLESSVRGLMENGSEKPKQAEHILHEQGGNDNSSSSDSMDLAHGCCKVPGDLNKKINSPRQNKHMLGAEGVNQTVAKSGLLRRTNNAQTFEYISGSGPEVASYHIPSKVSNKLEYINDLPFQMSVGVQKQDSPWRYLPVVKRVKLAIQSPLVQKDDSEMTTDQIGSSLHLTDRDSTSELEDGSQDRRTYLSDAKFGPVGRKASIATSTTNVSTTAINAYRKLENEAEERRRTEKLERIDIQQRMVRMERELRLQKSLSEECEDLGVDEPSTSDLFPEADLLLDTNSSPSFDQTGQDASCSQSVGASESYPASNFRPMEYSSSSQEASRESPVDNPATEDTEKFRPLSGLRKTYGDWKFRLLGKDRNKGTLSARGAGGKLGLLSSTVKSNSSIHSNTLTGSKDVSRNTPLIDERLNGNSKSAPPDSSSSLSHDSSSMASINTTNTAPEKGITSEKPLNGDSKDILTNVLLEKPLNVDSHMSEMTEESQDSGPKQPSHSASSVANVGNISTKTPLSVTSSSEDSVTMDAFTANTVASPLDVTMLPPVLDPMMLSSRMIDRSSSSDPLPSLTAAQKFTYTYGKKHGSNRQDVGRIITRSRLNRPNQYLSDHVDSQETWDSSSSQDKTCADDEDSEMSPSSQLSSQVDDGEGNSDVDVVEISNEESSSSALGSVQSTMFPLLPSVITKAPISQSHEITFKSSTNGVDSLDGNNPLNAGKRVRVKRTRSEMQFTQKNTIEANYVDMHTKEEDIKDSQKYDRSGLLREKRFKGFHSVSKVTVPMKQSSLSSAECNQRKQTVLRSKQHRIREICEDSSADMFQLLHNPTTMTETDMLPSPEESSDNILTKVRLEGKEECSNEGTCGTHVKPTRSLRRKGYIRKCQCCNGSPERPKKKKHVAKVEKPMKKGQQPSKQIGKTNVVKKR